MSEAGSPTAKAAQAVRVAALLLVAAGLAVAFGAGWQWLGKVRYVTQAQRVLSRELDGRWAAGGDAVDPPPAGAPIARLHLPTVGATLVVVEGAAEAQLKSGPGRLLDSAPLGGTGNAAVAGHRYPGVFWDLDLLEPGDPVVVETATSWHVYRTVRTLIVEPTDETVVAPSADRAGPVLTLITCEPKLSTSQRLVKQAELVRTDPRDPAPSGATVPPELSAGAHR